MAKKLFVGNMPWSMTEEQLKELFAPFGAMEECIIKTDKFTGRSRGFGFVTYTNDEDADKAVEALNGHEVEYTMMRDGVEETAKRALVVNESRPMEERPPRREFGGERRGGGNFRRGGGNFRREGGNRGDYGNRRDSYDDNGFEMN